MFIECSQESMVFLLCMIFKYFSASYESTLNFNDDFGRRRSDVLYSESLSHNAIKSLPNILSAYTPKSHLRFKPERQRSRRLEKRSEYMV